MMYYIEQFVRNSIIGAEIEKRLSQNFIRCHRSFIVNLNYIDYVDKKNSVIILKNDSTCYLARRKLKVILERLAAIKSL
ncbi:LytTR family DNA-binding domain-containing protein [Latilactobacillus sakei]|uniref:LytTR family DNA-binding domain-containing protein n=1 Tax=Latilactobacillus sakei TaxID=1599 RepID=UPI0032EC861F